MCVPCKGNQTVQLLLRWWVLIITALCLVSRQTKPQLLEMNSENKDSIAACVMNKDKG